MDIGVPKEIKEDEERVALLPVGARSLVEEGHRVLVERGAGRGAGAADGEYEAAGRLFVCYVRFSCNCRFDGVVVYLVGMRQ